MVNFRRYFSIIVSVSIFVLGISNYVYGQLASGWYGLEEFDKAVEMAKKTNRPLAFLYRGKDSTCPKHNNQCEEWEEAWQLEKFVRVIIYTKGSMPYRFRTLMSQVKNKGKYIPHLFLSDNNFNLLGYVPYGAEEQEFENTVNAVLKKIGPTGPKKKIKPRQPPTLENKAKALYTLGENYRLNKMYPQAIREYEKLIKGYPDTTWATKAHDQLKKLK